MQFFYESVNYKFGGCEMYFDIFLALNLYLDCEFCVVYPNLLCNNIE